MPNQLLRFLYLAVGVILTILPIFMFNQLFATAFYFEPLDGFPGFYFLCAEIKWFYLPFLQLLISAGVYLIIIQLVALLNSISIAYSKVWKLVTILTSFLWLLLSILFHISAPITRKMFPYNFIQSCDGTGFKSAFIDYHLTAFYTVSYATIIPILSLVFYTISKKNKTINKALNIEM